MVKKKITHIAMCALMMMLALTSCQSSEKPRDKSLKGTAWHAEAVVSGAHREIDLLLGDDGQTFKFVYSGRTKYEEVENEYTGTYRYVAPKLTLDMLQANGQRIKYHLIMKDHTLKMIYEGYEYTLTLKM